MTHEQPVTIVIADDHQIYLDSVRSVLSEHGFQIVGVALDGREAVRLCVDLHPDAAILDISMPELNGIEAAREIAKLHPREVVILSMHTDINYVLESLCAGFHAYVAKSKAAACLIEAIGTARDGGTSVCIPPALACCQLHTIRVGFLF